MKTAIEWLVDELELDMFATDEEMEIIIKAKEMHKEQIIDAYQTSHISMMTAEQYYNETFRKNETFKKQDNEQ
jgi:hypothetical protein